MSSPFTVLDKQKRKNATIGDNNKSCVSSSLPRSNSSLFDKVEQQSKPSLKKSTSTGNIIPDSKSLASSKKSSKSNTLFSNGKKSSLSSLLRAQSKFSGKSSVVSSKSRAVITKPIAKSKSIFAKDTTASTLVPNNSRLIRELPWTASKALNMKTTTKLKQNDKSFGISITGSIGLNNYNNNKDKNNNNSGNSHLVAIDTNVHGVALSDEQQRVLDVILNKRKNVFFTGSAGTGKSFLLKLIIRKLQTRYGKSNIGISAPTGLAAANIGGQTIQRLFGIGLGKEPADILLSKIKKNMDRYMVWRRMVVLIIDEISMLDLELFDKLNFLAKKIKRSEKPFGGIQVIICGDFLQLPPVTKISSASVNYCFKSKSWKEIIDENIILSKVFRQQGDSELIDILNSLRIGKIDYKIENRLRKLSRSIDFNDGIEPTELFPTREEVERSNLNKLNQLNGSEIVFNCEDVSLIGLPIDDKIKKSFELLMCSPVLKLKIGAQVMLIKNDVDSNLVNGQLGIVIAFLTKPIYHSFQARFGYEFSPANLAILEKINMILFNKRNITKIPENNDLSLLDPFTAELVQELLRSYDPKDEIMPLVRFTLKENFYHYILIEKSEFKPDFGKTGDGGFVRRQLPIILAWSMSIHKSQGQTLERVKVDLRKVFEKGQLYVAISRCVSSRGLQILNFDRRKVFVDEEVISFYSSIGK